MILIRLHRFAPPPHQGQIPNLQGPLEDGDGEEAGVVKVIGLDVSQARQQFGILGLVEPYGAISKRW